MKGRGEEYAYLQSMVVMRAFVDDEDSEGGSRRVRGGWVTREGGGGNYITSLPRLSPLPSPLSPLPSPLSPLPSPLSPLPSPPLLLSPLPSIPRILKHNLFRYNLPINTCKKVLVLIYIVHQKIKHRRRERKREEGKEEKRETKREV